MCSNIEMTNYPFAAKCCKDTLTLLQRGVSPEFDKLMTWNFTYYTSRYLVTSLQSFIALQQLEGSAVDPV